MALLNASGGGVKPLKMFATHAGSYPISEASSRCSRCSRSGTARTTFNAVRWHSRRYLLEVAVAALGELSDELRRLGQTIVLETVSRACQVAARSTITRSPRWGSVLLLLCCMRASLRSSAFAGPSVRRSSEGQGGARAALARTNDLDDEAGGARKKAADDRRRRTSCEYEAMTMLITRRLLLDAWDERWREEWIALAADARVTRWIGGGEAWDRSRSEAQFEWMLDHWRQHNFGWRSAIDKASGAWVGFIGLNYVTPNAIELDEGDVEIGWWLRPEVWGRGLATEGALAGRDEAFQRVDLDRIVSRHHAGNPASGRIMEKIGMHFVRQAVGRHGERVRIYALERDDWAALNNGSSDDRMGRGRSA